MFQKARCWILWCVRRATDNLLVSRCHFACVAPRGHPFPRSSLWYRSAAKSQIISAERCSWSFAKLKEGHEFLRLCKKRNRGATLHLLDVLVTLHAKWTAKRICRGLFGQSLVDFSTESWASIHLKESAKGRGSEQKRTQPKKTPRILRSFAPYSRWDEAKISASCSGNVTV